MPTFPQPELTTLTAAAHYDCRYLKGLLLASLPTRLPLLPPPLPTTSLPSVTLPPPPPAPQPRPLLLLLLLRLLLLLLLSTTATVLLPPLTLLATATASSTATAAATAISTSTTATCTAAAAAAAAASCFCFDHHTTLPRHASSIRQPRGPRLISDEDLKLFPFSWKHTQAQTLVHAARYGRVS